VSEGNKNEVLHKEKITVSKRTIRSAKICVYSKTEIATKKPVACNIVRHINEVKLRQARLVLGSVTTFGDIPLFIQATQAQ